jgi:uncharacterized glyoxalase superfamily protein PhnB
MAETVEPYVLYEDAASAMEFLSLAFGFREVLRSHSPEGRVWHAEMALGEGTLFLGQPGSDHRSPKRSGAVTVAIHVYVDDVDAHYERAKAAGATIRKELADRDYGERRYHAEDPEGHVWMFSQRIREVLPEDWGAMAATEATE